MSDRESDEALNAETREALRQAFEESYGAFACPDLPPVARFAVNVIATLRRRSENPRSVDDGSELALFLLSEHPRTDAPSDAVTVPLIADGSEMLNGGIWYVPVGVTSARNVAVPYDSQRTAFEIVEETPGSSGKPAVVYNPKASRPEIRIYPNGLSEIDTYIVETLEQKVFSKEVLDQELEKFHFNNLRSPERNNGVVWQQPTQAVPMSDAEKRIQIVLVAVLEARLDGCYITSEETTEAGRTDIFVKSIGHGQPAYLAALELKVLRSKWGSGAKVPNSVNDEAVRKGFLQAHAYRSERGASCAYLCCYDMRQPNQGETCFDIVHERARRTDVVLRRWYIPNSVERYRDEYYNQDG